MKYCLAIIAVFFMASCAKAQPSYNQVNVVPNQANTDTGSVNFQSRTGSPRFKVILSAPDTMASDLRYRLPATDGVGCIGSDGFGNLSIVACSGAGTLPPFVDTTSIVMGSADSTKQIRFEVDGLTTATTRVLTPQDANYTLAGTNIAQTFSANQTYAANILFSGLRDIGTSVAPASNLYFNQARVPVGPCFLAGITTTVGPNGLVYVQNSGCNTTAELTGSGVNVSNGATYQVAGITVIDNLRRLTLDNTIPNVGSSLIPITNFYTLGTTANPFAGVFSDFATMRDIAPTVAWQPTSQVGTSGLPYANGYFQRLNLGTSAGQGINTNVLPTINETYNIGELARPFSNIVGRFIRAKSASGGAQVQVYNSADQLRVSFGDGVLQGGNFELYDNSGFIKFSYIDNILTLGGGTLINGVMSPNGTNTFDLGSSANNWRRLYVQGVWPGGTAPYTGNCATTVVVSGGIVTGCI